MNVNSIFKWIFLILSIQLILGCYHLQWKSNANNKIGKNINDSKMTLVHGGSTFEQAKKNGRLYKVELESPNKRYYIYYFPWQDRCQYSLLVSPDGTILSWDFVDYKKRKECYVY